MSTRLATTRIFSSFVASWFLALLVVLGAAECGDVRAGQVQELIDEGVLVLYHDYRAGHFLDLSGQGNDGVATDVVWGKGAQFPASTSKVTVADVAELQGTEFTLVILGEFVTQGSQERWVNKRDAGGTQYHFGTSATQLVLRDGIVTRTLVTSVIGKKYIAVNFANGETPEGFLDGISAGAFSGTVSISADDAPVTIGGLYLSTYNALGTFHAALIVNRKLTPPEHSALYAELAALTWPSKASGHGRGSYGAELLTDGDQEAVGVGAWPALDATPTKQVGNALAGSQVLRLTATADAGAKAPRTFQNILTSGKRYRVSGYARSDGTEIPIANSGGSLWVGTNSTSWQFFDVVFDAIEGYSRLTFTLTDPAGTEYVEFDNVTVREIESDEVQFKTDWAAHTSIANVTVGYLENTPFQVASGAFKIVTDTIDGETVKAIECVTAGVVYINASLFQVSPTLAAYGTWEWWVYKAAASTTKVHFISPDVAGSGGYRIGLTVSEHVELVETGVVSLFQTAGGYISDSQWYKIKITRAQSDGEMTAYLDDVLIVEDTGSNPTGAENTTTTSFYIVFDLDAGDKISLGSLSGDHTISKGHGVQ